MKLSRIFYAFVLVFAFAVYYFDYYKGEEDIKKKDAASVIIPFAREQINKIEIKKTASNEEIQLVKEANTWKLTKPITDLADETVIGDWLNSLVGEKAKDTLGAGESINWTYYGLDKPKGQLLIYKESGEKVSLELSPRKNFEGSSFLRKDQANEVLVASASWSGHFEKNTFDFRDKRLLREKIADIESLTIYQGKARLGLQLKEGLWFIADKIALKLSQNAVRDVVNAVNEMRAQSFVTEVDPSEKEKTDYALKAPSMSLELKFKGEKSWRADFGQTKDKAWYAWPKDLHRVVKIDAGLVEKITKASTDSLRDREAPFVFKKDEVKKISIQNAKDPAKSLELSKVGENWQASQPGQVDASEVNGLLNRLSDLRIADFSDGKTKAPGIDPAAIKIILADGDGKVIWSLDIGDSFKKKIDKTETQYFYVKTSSYGDVFSVLDSAIQNLGYDKLQKEKK